MQSLCKQNVSMIVHSWEQHWMCTDLINRINVTEFSWIYRLCRLRLLSSASSSRQLRPALTCTTLPPVSRYWMDWIMSSSDKYLWVNLQLILCSSQGLNLAQGQGFDPQGLLAKANECRSVQIWNIDHAYKNKKSHPNNQITWTSLSSIW